MQRQSPGAMSRSYHLIAAAAAAADRIQVLPDDESESKLVFTVAAAAVVGYHNDSESNIFFGNYVPW